MKTARSRVDVIDAARTAVLLGVIALQPMTYVFRQRVGLGAGVALLVVVALVAWRLNPSRSLRVAPALIVLLMIGLILLSAVLASDSSNFSVLLSVYFLIAYVLSQAYGREEFPAFYAKAMYWLSAYSLVATYVIIAFSSLFVGVLPEVLVFEKGMRLLDAGLCYVYIPYDGVQLRNFSIFSEPGMLQFFVLLALVFELGLVKPEQRSPVRVLVFTLTLVSTFSPVGLVGGLLVWAGYILSRNAEGTRLRTTVGWALTAVALVYLLIPTVAVEVDNAMGKFGGLSGGQQHGSSAGSRLRSATGMLEAGLDRPWAGWGYQAVSTDVMEEYVHEYTYDNTNTMATNFALYGLAYALLYALLFYRYFLGAKTSAVFKVLTLIAMTLSINNERLIDSTVVIVLLLQAAPSLRRAHALGGTRDGNRLESGLNLRMGRRPPLLVSAPLGENLPGEPCE